MPITSGTTIRPRTGLLRPRLNFSKPLRLDPPSSSSFVRNSRAAPASAPGDLGGMTVGLAGHDGDDHGVPVGIRQQPLRSLFCSGSLPSQVSVSRIAPRVSFVTLLRSASRRKGKCAIIFLLLTEHWLELCDQSPESDEVADAWHSRGHMQPARRLEPEASRLARHPARPREGARPPADPVDRSPGALGFCGSAVSYQIV